MKLNSRLVLSLVLLSGKAAWAGCGPPQCDLPPITTANPATVVDCHKACATCGGGQACHCDPGSGFYCLNRPQKFSLFSNDENGIPILQEDQKEE